MRGQRRILDQRGLISRSCVVVAVSAMQLVVSSPVFVTVSVETPVEGRSCLEQPTRVVRLCCVLPTHTYSPSGPAETTQMQLALGARFRRRAGGTRGLHTPSMRRKGAGMARHSHDRVFLRRPSANCASRLGPVGFRATCRRWMFPEKSAHPTPGSIQTSRQLYTPHWIYPTHLGHSRVAERSVGGGYRRETRGGVPMHLHWSQ